MPVTKDEIRQTLRVSRRTHPDDYDFLCDTHIDGEPWTVTMLRVVGMAREFCEGNPQILQIERRFDAFQDELLSSLQNLTSDAIKESELILERKAPVNGPPLDLPELDLNDDPLGNMEGWD
jgi:hypothetical protein